MSRETVSPFSAGTQANPPVSPMDKTKVFYIAVGVACSIIFIIALAVAAIHVHSMPNPNSNKDGARLVAFDLDDLVSFNRAFAVLLLHAM